MDGDRAGQVYLALGGVTASIGGGIVGTRFDELVWIVIGSVMFVLGTYALLASLANWPLPFRRPARIRLADAATSLASEIMVWCGDRQRDNPITRPESRFDGDAHLRYSIDTVARWNERFALRALTLFDRMVREGVGDPADRFRIEHPTNPFGIEKVARILGVMADQLR